MLLLLFQGTVSNCRATIPAGTWAATYSLLPAWGNAPTRAGRTSDCFFVLLEHLTQRWDSCW